MTEPKTDTKGPLYDEAFPLSSKYDPAWVYANEMGPNVLWLTELLCRAMDIRSGMRVLDMGCGKALSSIFLAKESGVEVWATDLWIGATENWRRVREAGVEKQVFPIHADARSLPFAEEFFDAILSLDSYHYFGTDDAYLSRFVRLLKPGGQIGIIVPGFIRDFGRDVPEHLLDVYAEDWYTFHTAEWWRWHWEKTRLVNVELADILPDGWQLWMKWETAQEAAAGVPEPGSEAEILRADGGENIGFVRIVARRRDPTRQS